MVNQIRFRLRSLVLCIGLVAIVLGLVRNEILFRAHTERLIRLAGGQAILATQFDFDKTSVRRQVWWHRAIGSPVVVGLQLGTESITPTALRDLAEYKYLQYLELTRRNAGTDGQKLLSDISKIRNIRELRLVAFVINDFSVLDDLEYLDTLDVAHSSSDNWESITSIQSLKLVMIGRPGRYDTEDSIRRKNALGEQLSRLLPEHEIVGKGHGDFLSGVRNSKRWTRAQRQEDVHE